MPTAYLAGHNSILVIILEKAFKILLTFGAGAEGYSS